MKKIFFLIFILILCIGSASAIKVSGRVEIDFKPNLVYEGQVCVIPERIAGINLNVYGPLADYIELSHTELDLSEGPECVPYTIRLPSKMPEPGIQTSEIRVREKRPKGQAIAAVVSIGHQIRLNVPYPGKYVDVTLKADNVEEGLPVNFYAGIHSRGEDTIKKITGRIVVTDWNDKVVGEIITNAVNNLFHEESVELTGNWDSTGHPVGDYRGRIEIDYDGNKAEAAKRFKIGTKEVRLKDYTKKVFKRGVEPYSLQLESYWSEVIPGIRGTINILDSETQETTTVDTVMTQIPPWGITSIKGYVDTTGLSIGNHSTNITVFYDDTSRFYERNLEVAEVPKAVVEKPGMGHYVKSYFNSPKAMLMTTALLAIIVLLLAMKVIFGGKKPPEEPVQQNPYVGNF